MPELIRTLKDEETVVFHCVLSQQRGPSSALKYLRGRDAMFGEQIRDAKQKVYVLDGGFQKWQEK
jgi:Cdc25 family phosphatase